MRMLWTTFALSPLVLPLVFLSGMLIDEYILPTTSKARTSVTWCCAFLTLVCVLEVAAIVATWTVFNPFWWAFRRLQRRVSQAAIRYDQLRRDKKRRQQNQERLTDLLIKLDHFWYL